MRPSSLLGALLLAFSCAGCQTCESADLARYTERHGFPISTHPVPPHAIRIGIVSVQEDGFYVCGLLPIVPVSLQSCLDRMMKEAKQDGASGIAEVRYAVNPAHLFKFTSFGFPDWGAMVRVTGTVYRSTQPLAEPTPRVHTTPPAPAKD